MSVPHHDGLLVDRIYDGMATDFAMRLKEVTLAVLDRITREVKSLSESVRKVNVRQICSEAGPWANGGPEDLFDAGENNPMKEDGGEVWLMFSGLLNPMQRREISAQYDAVMWNESCS